jgi:hypothetical protein
MASNCQRHTGSNLGRAAIDWEQAFAFYAALPPHQRCYQAVADRFGVSVRTVEKHGRNDHWKQRLQSINAHATAEADAALGEARAEHLVNIAKLIEASLIGYAEELRRGEVPIRPADLQRLHKLWRELNDELGVANAPTSTSPPEAIAPRSAEHTAAVIAALRESGALAALGLHTNDPPEVSR